MLLDARNAQEVPNSVHAPIVIVGAGTVGLFLAMNLARAKIPTLVLESGDRVAAAGRAEQTAVSVGKIHNGTKLGRAFGLGGTSTLWRGQLAEFDAFDLVAPGREWPIAYFELKQWYERVYGFLGVAPKPFATLVPDGDGEDELQSEIERFCTFWLPRQNFALRFKADIETNPDLKIVLNATVNDITFADSKATKVSAVAPGGRKIEVSGEDFVFASGTLEIVRFFLSMQRLSNVPWQDNKNIGTYFQDHFAGKVGDVQIDDEKKFRGYFENGFIPGLKFQPKLRYASSIKRPPSSGVVGYFSFESKLTETLSDLKFLVRALQSGASYAKLRTLPANLWSLGSAFFPLAVRYARDRRILALMDRGVEFHVQAEQIPVADSAIRLRDETIEPDGLFRADVDWKLDGGEVGHVRDFALRSNAYLQRKKIARIDIDRRLLDGDPTVLDRFGDMYHQCGGMCIGPSPAQGVVDGECRVFGTSNVHVSGASVFPTSSHANCSLTALALSARLAATLERT